MHRRDVIRMMGAWSAAIALAPIAKRRRAVTIRVIVVSRRAASSASEARDRGVTLGVEEAAHAATLFGGAIEATTFVAESVPELRESMRSALGSSRLTALIGGDDVAMCAALAEAAQAHDCIHINVTCTSDAVRERECRRRSFHVCPSEAMQRDASGGRPTSDERVLTWDAGLEKYGADTLNRRFENRFHAPMTGDAWCGWMAVKVLWEAALRSRATDAHTLMSYLESERAAFDGHKGRPLSFRSWDHQMRQPLYRRTDADGRGIVEVPAGGNPDDSSRDLLDRIGTPASRSACRWGTP